MVGQNFFSKEKPMYSSKPLKSIDESSHLLIIPTKMMCLCVVDLLLMVKNKEISRIRLPKYRS